MQCPSLDFSLQGADLTPATNIHHALRPSSTYPSTRTSSLSTPDSDHTHDSKASKPLDTLELIRRLPAHDQFDSDITSGIRQLCPPAYTPYLRRRSKSVATGKRRIERQYRARLHPSARDFNAGVNRAASRTRSVDRGFDTFKEQWKGDYLEAGPAPIAETNPENTTTLWDFVWDAVSMGEPSEGVRTRAQRGKLSSRNQSQFDENASVSSDKRLTPASKDFQALALTPRAIHIDPAGFPVLAHVHFGVDEPARGRDEKEHYTQVRGAFDTNVWVEGSDTLLNFITASYKRMTRRHLCEEEFASFAKENLLKQERSLLDESRQGVWKTERMLQLVVKADRNSLWKIPPLIFDPKSVRQKGYQEYNFDIRPDCCYWLNVFAYNQEYVSQVETWTYVHQQEITCPYLTIEFKRDHASEEQARLQVVAAAAVALYNRFELRNRRLQTQGAQWTEALRKVIRHYGLTFSGSKYTVWVIEPRSSTSAWDGCVMRRLAFGYCEHIADVRKLVQWINEIHCWGLTTHARRCQKDVKLTMEAHQRSSGQRVSDIQADSEDGEEQ